MDECGEKKPAGWAFLRLEDEEEGEDEEEDEESNFEVFKGSFFGGGLLTATDLDLNL